MILGLGHPRTGTGFTSKLCCLWGLDVGHEVRKFHGVVDWRYVMPSGPYPFNRRLPDRPEFKHLIYNVRDPKTSIASILYTENTNLWSREYRSSFLKYPHTNALEFTISSIVTFDKLINSMHPNCTFRIEDQQKKLYDYLESVGYTIKYVEYNTPVNTRQHSTLENALTEHTASSFHQKLMHNFCDKYGYSRINF